MLLLATGGTFDKDYDPITGQLYFPNSQVPQQLQQARLGFNHSCDILMQKDSLEMTEADREAIKRRCHRYAGSQIVIIHGTDTMVETAQYLAQHSNGEQTIVLTGAMRPAAFSPSDACFNLGFAIASARYQAAGVYVAMNGMCFSADQVTKNRTLGMFEGKTVT
jgi:L-asparaginase